MISVINVINLNPRHSGGTSLFYELTTGCVTLPSLLRILVSDMGFWGQKRQYITAQFHLIQTQKVAVKPIQKLKGKKQLVKVLEVIQKSCCTVHT